MIASATELAVAVGGVEAVIVCVTPPVVKVVV